MQPPRDHLSIRTFLDEVRQAGSYDEGLIRLGSRFAKRQDVQNVGYLYRSLLKRNPETADVARRPSGPLEDEIKAFTLSYEFKQRLWCPCTARISRAAARFIRPYPQDRWNVCPSCGRARSTLRRSSIATFRC